MCSVRKKVTKLHGSRFLINIYFMKEKKLISRYFKMYLICLKTKL